MTNKEIEEWRELAREQLRKGFTKEEATLALQRAGIFDKNGNFTAPYKNLERAIRKGPQNSQPPPPRN